MGRSVRCVCFFFKQKTAYEMPKRLEFRRVLFRSTSYFRIGGLALEPPRGWHARIKTFIDIFPSRIDEYENLLTNNRIWIGRTKGVGVISLEDMLDLGVTGPMLRAAGVKTDARKDAPYTSYEKFDFEIPTRTENDVYARYQIGRASCRGRVEVAVGG